MLLNPIRVLMNYGSRPFFWITLRYQLRPAASAYGTQPNPAPDPMLQKWMGDGYDSGYPLVQGGAPPVTS